MIAGVFLAAGRSRRFGADKLTHKIKGLPLIQHSLNVCLKSSLSRIYVVLGSGSETLAEIVTQSIDNEQKITIVWNENAERGMMSSLKRGILSLEPQVQGAMVILADMPFVTTGLVDLLASRFEDTNGIVIPQCDGVLYHPRVIPRRLFPEFLALGDGDRGSTVIDRFHGDIVRVKTGDRHTYVDIDAIEDLDSMG